jgi:Flp pilus assembly protein TadD
MPSADSSALLRTTGLAAGTLGLAFADGSAAQARQTGLKDQADALRAAAAARASAAQPAALSPDQLYDQGKALLAGNDIPGAMAAFRRLLAHDPQSLDAMNGLGIAYDRMGRHDVARGWYESALAINPDAASVLSNLGYSLLLADQPRAAIPWLQAAASSRDPRAVATARRLLSQIGARLTAEAAAAPAAPRAAEIALVTTPAPAAPAPDAPVAPLLASAPAPLAVAALAEFEPQPAPRPRAELQDPAQPSARIELAANGEARLVLGSSAPAPALVAALGEAATLVLVAAPWTEKDDARLLAEDRSPARALPGAPARMLALATPQARLVMVETPALRLDRPLVAPLVLAAAPDVVAQPSVRARPAPVAQAVERAAASEPRRFANLALTNGVGGKTRALPVLRAAPMLPPPGTGWRRTADGDATPAWLIAVRRTTPQNSPAPTAPLAHPDGPASISVFDSDDEALNRFAARHRTLPDTESPAARQAAIARLEALIARVRRA